MRPPGRFIALEGIDGAGKTTVAAAVARRLSDKRVPVKLLQKRSPQIEDPFVARQLGRLSATIWPTAPTDPQYLLSDRYYLFLLAALFEGLDACVVRPALQAGLTLISDGWIHKVRARNRLRKHIPGHLLRATLGHITRPHCVIILDCDPTVAASRKQSLGNAECGINDGHTGGRVEGFIAYQTRFRKALLAETASQERLIIDTYGMSVSEVVARVESAIHGAEPFGADATELGRAGTDL